MTSVLTSKQWKKTLGCMPDLVFNHFCNLRYAYRPVGGRGEISAERGAIIIDTHLADEGPAELSQLEYISRNGRAFAPFVAETEPDGRTFSRDAVR